MKTTWKQRALSPWAIAGIAAIIVLGLVFTGCGTDNDNESTGKSGPVAVKTVTLSQVVLSLGVGGTETLTVDIMPKRATNKSVTWESSNRGVATVINGFVLAVAEGKAIITVTTQNGMTDTCEVNVVPPIDVTGVTLPATLAVRVGETQTLTPTIEPAKATNQKVSWLSDDEDVATVTGGRVRGVAEGTATITVTTEDGGFEAECEVTVTAGGTGPGPGPGGDMVWIQPGTFSMGSPTNESDRNSDETEHSVTLNGFFMGKKEVTQGEWEQIMGENVYCWFPDGESYADVSRWREFPVEVISWYETIVYCNKRSMNENLPPVYEMQAATGTNWSTDPSTWGAIPESSTTRWNNVRMVADSTGYRLPTEAEWEYACRAGANPKTAFNTGTTINGTQAQIYTSTPQYTTLPVGSFAPNAWGLYDMHGNVVEWCWDWYGENYYSNGQVNPTGPASGSERVIRGGAWWDDPEWLRSACRDALPPHYWGYPNTGNSLSAVVGFRVVRNGPASTTSQMLSTVSVTPEAQGVIPAINRDKRDFSSFLSEISKEALRPERLMMKAKRMP
jgi:formylglycine-generating enzyme required for sulfatase activity